MTTDTTTTTQIDPEAAAVWELEITEIADEAAYSASAGDFAAAARHFEAGEKLFGRLCSMDSAAADAAEDHTGGMESHREAQATRERIHASRRSAFGALNYAHDQINAHRRAQAAADALTAEIIEAGGTLTTKTPAAVYTATRQIAEHIAGRPVLGMWQMHAANCDDDGAGLTSYQTAGDLLIAMKKIAPTAKWMQP